MADQTFAPAVATPTLAGYVYFTDAATGLMKKVILSGMKTVLLDGVAGWAPVFSIVTDGARKVMKVVDWTGGIGAKPAINQFLSPTGFTLLIAEATDIAVEGAKGDDGDQGEPGPAITAASLLAMFAVTGSVVAELEGDEVRLSINWDGVWENPNDIPDVPGATLTKGRAQTMFPGLTANNATIAALVARIEALEVAGGGSGFEPSDNVGLLGWWKGGEGETIVGGKVTGWASMNAGPLTIVGVAGDEPNEVAVTGGLGFAGGERAKIVGLDLSGTSDVVIYMAVKYDNLAGGNVVLMHGSDYASGNSLAIIAGDPASQVYAVNKLGAEINLKGFLSAPAGELTVTRGEFYRSKASAESILYINGVAGTADYSGTQYNADIAVPYANADLHFGSFQGDDTQSFTGVITDIIIVGAQQDGAAAAQNENYLKTLRSIAY